MEEKIYTIEELAQRWGVHYNTVYRLIQSQRLKAFKVGSNVRITAAEVHRFENNRST